MSARRITTAWLGHSLCCSAVWFATPVRAQLTAHWQATTASTWASGDVCASSRAVVAEPLGSSQAIGAGLTFGEHRALSATVAGTGGVAAGQPLCDRRWSGLLTAQASYTARDTRFWIAYSRSNAINADTIVRQPGLAIGMARRVGATIVALSVGPRRDRTSSERVIESRPHLSPEVIVPVPGAIAVQDTVMLPDTVTRFGRREISDVGLGMSWTRRALGIEAGAHFGLVGALRRVDPLGTLRISYAVTSRLSAIGALTSRTAVPTRDLPATQMVTLGLRISGSHAVSDRSGRSPATAAELRVARDAAGRLTISIRAPRAERVQIAGEFTQWAPLDLERLRGGWWQLRVRTPRGTHRVSVRIDGGRWMAPPGLPPVQDEFGGTVGLLVVQ